MRVQKEFEERFEILCLNHLRIFLRYNLEYSFAYYLHFELLLVKADQRLFGYFRRLFIQFLTLYYVVEQHPPENLRYFADFSRYGIKLVLSDIRLPIKRLFYCRFSIRLFLPRYWFAKRKVKWRYYFLWFFNFFRYVLLRWKFLNTGGTSLRNYHTLLIFLFRFLDPVIFLIFYSLVSSTHW